jgi:hypothetical protein
MKIAKLHTAGIEWGQCPFHDWHGQEMRQERLRLVVVRLVEEPGGQIHELRMCVACARLVAGALPSLISLADGDLRIIRTD